MAEHRGTLADLLERAASLEIGGVRLVDRREAETFWTWSDLHRRAQRVAGGLQELGVAPGERVALIYPTSEEFLAAFFGVALAGAVPAPLYPPLRLGRLAEYHRQTARQIRLAGARLVLADRAVSRILGEAIAAAAPELGCRTVAELTEAPAAGPAGVGPEDLGLLQFSSGTTVEPRPVALTHRALVAQVRTLNALWPDTDDVTHSGVSWLPLYHDMGLIGALLCALERPGVVTLLPPEAFAARPALWLRAISRHRATISAAPNFAYALATARIEEREMEGVDLSSWRVALDGAEPISAAVLRAFSARFARWGFRAAALTPVYGLAEAALAVTFSDLAAPFRARRFARAALAEEGRAVITEDGTGRELVGLGRALPGFALELRDDAGQPLAEGRVGRLFVRGPSLFSGYLGQPDLSAAALAADGWLDTGDLGFLWRGELYLTGRAKDVLILRGRNHAPEEVEEAAQRVPAVRAAAAVSHGREDGGGEALVVLAEHQRAAAPEAVAAIPRLVRDEVLAATGLAADRVEVLAPHTLPRTSSGKVRRGEALRLHLAGELRPPEPVSARTLGAALRRSARARRRKNVPGSGEVSHGGES